MRAFRNAAVGATVLGLAAAPVLAQSTFPMPDIGVDIGELVADAVVVIGVAVGTCLAAWFAFLALKVGVRWARGIGK